MASNEKTRNVRLPNVVEALIPIVVMIGLMLYHFIGKTDYKDAHMPLAVAIVVACIIGWPVRPQLLRHAGRHD